MTQYRETRQWRDKNHLIELYEAIDVTHFDETRRMVSLLFTVRKQGANKGAVYALDWKTR